MRLTPKIFLSNALLLTALIACGTAYYLTSVALSKSRSELESLRSDVGLLNIDDDTKIHALALPAFDSNQWRWKVYLPKHAKYRLCYAVANIPQDGKPEQYMQDDRVLTPRPTPTGSQNSFVFSCGLCRDVDGKMKLGLRGPSQSARHNVGESEWFAAGRPDYSIAEGVSDRSTSSSTSELVLLRWRRGKVTASGTAEEPLPTDGLMFWIEKID